MSDYLLNQVNKKHQQTLNVCFLFMHQGGRVPKQTAQNFGEVRGKGQITVVSVGKSVLFS